VSKLESVVTEAAAKVDIGEAKWYEDATGKIVFPVFGKERSANPEFALYILHPPKPLPISGAPFARATTIFVNWIELAAIDFDPSGTKQILEAKIKEATQCLTCKSQST
jgi:hypothetical protein